MATIPEAWISALIFGNVWAFFWIFSMMLTYTPGLWNSICGMCGGKKKKKEDSGVQMPANTDSQPRRRIGRKNTEMELADIAQNFKSARDSQPDEGDKKTIQLPAASDRTVTSGIPLSFGTEGQDNDPSDHPRTIMRQMTRTQTMLIPPVELEWRNVGCNYRNGSTVNTVLEGVYGLVKPQEMMALMGPSGAGKSTLLDILTMRKTVGELSGEVMMNGQAREGGFLRMSSYVPQEDNFIPTMTTLETLTFFARLVLPRTTSSEERRRRVEEVLFMVGLKHAKGTMVGGLLPGGIHLRGLSGGERRRLSIAAGVVSAPSIIFLDEPTSGLDSFAALNVMQYMKSLAQYKAHTIIASIHQPRMSIWNMFDKVAILSKGRMMYSGRTDLVANWFTEKLGYDYDPKIHGVVSDWVIDLVSIGFSKPDQFYGKSMRTEKELLDAASKFYREYKALKQAEGRGGDEETGDADAEEEVMVKPALVRKTTTHFVVEPKMGICNDTSTSNGGPKKELRSLIPIFWQGYPTSWLNQFLTLLWRSLLNVTRNPADVAGRMLTFTYVGSFIGLVFYNLPADLTSVITKLNIIFNSASFFMFIPYTSMSLFTSDRQFYAADVTAKLYDSSAYYMANFISNFPFATLNAAVFALIVYGMAGLNPDFGSIWRHVLLAVLESLISLQVLHFAAVATHNQDTAFMVAITFTAINVIVSNFFILFDSIALPGVRWLQYISAMGYTFNGAIRLEFGDHNYSCAGDLGITGAATNATELLYTAFPNSRDNIDLLLSLSTVTDNSDCVFVGDSILDYFKITRPFGQTAGILVAYLLVLHCLTYLALIFLAKKDKR